MVAVGVIIVTFQGSRADLQLRPSLYAFTAQPSSGVGLIASSQAGDAIGPLNSLSYFVSISNRPNLVLFVFTGPRLHYPKTW